MIRLSAVSLSLLMFGFQSPALAGGMSSSGTGEFSSPAQNPWFLGEETVRYCIQRSDDFSLPIEQARPQIEGVIKDWVSSISLRRIAPKTINNKAVSLSTFFKEDCSGKPDLVFMLGVIDDRVKELWTQGFLSNKLAFAAQTEFDFSTGRAKGIVWLIPDQTTGEYKYRGEVRVPDFWSQYNVFWNVMVHELGHVFGLRHQEVFSNAPMQSRFPERVVAMAGVAGQNKKVSSRQTLLHNFYMVEHPVCGYLAYAPTLTGRLKKILKMSDLGDLEDICVETTFDVLDFHYTFVFKTADGTPLFYLRGNFVSDSYEPVRGHYQGEEKSWLFSHEFFRISSMFMLRGQLQVGTPPGPVSNIAAILSNAAFLGAGQLILADGDSMIDMHFVPLTVKLAE